MKKTFLGIDLGTSAIKVVLLDESGAVADLASSEYETDHPFPGWSQIDPRVWYRHMVKCLKQLFLRNDPSSLQAVGVTGQMHTLVLLDEDGQPVRPAMMWNDTRTKEMVPVMREAVEKDPSCGHISQILSTGSPAANLYWVRQEEPECFSRIRHFLIGPDYLVYCLTGVYGTDYCEASTSSLFLLREHRWSETMRNLIGLDAAAYPPVRGSCQIAGYVLPSVSAQTGLGTGIPVVTGTGDNPASAISTGCLGQGYPVLSLGTSGVLMKPVASPDEIRKGKIILFSEDGKEFSYLVQGVVQSTGEAVNWWTRKILGRDDLGLMNDRLLKQMNAFREEQQAASELHFAQRLWFYPHLTGDKTLYADPYLRGSFIGLGADTTAEEMFYAVLEGLCFAVRELTEKMPLPVGGEVLRVVGGGSRSDIWLQLLSDILCCPVERLEGPAGPGVGAAMLAMLSSMRKEAPVQPQRTALSLSDLTRNLQKEEKIFQPDHETHAYFAEKYSRYLLIHDALKTVAGD